MENITSIQKVENLIKLLSPLASETISDKDIIMIDILTAIVTNYGPKKKNYNSQKRYYEKNKEKLLERNRKYYQTYYQNNKTKIIENRMKLYYNNKKNTQNTQE